MNFNELSSLWLMLANLGIKMTLAPLFDGYQIRGDGWDVICHSGSYGHEQGLLEIMARSLDGDVVGNLTAHEAYEIIAKEEGI